MEFDPEGRRLPIKVDTASNGEYQPRPLTGAEIVANDHARKCVGNAVMRLGVSRRALLHGGVPRNEPGALDRRNSAAPGATT